VALITACIRPTPNKIILRFISLSTENLPLAGRVVVVSVTEATAARSLALAGAAILVVGVDAEKVGGLVNEILSLGARASAFVGDPGEARESLAAMVAELFPLI
jgi:hypothetical protein